MWETDTVHPLKPNCNTSNSKMDCDLHSSTPTLSLQINFWTSSPSMPADPGPTSHSPASLFALQTRSTSPQPTRASQDSTCPCIHQNNYSELNFCSQSPPRCLGLCRSLSHGLSRMYIYKLCTCTYMYILHSFTLLGPWPLCTCPTLYRWSHIVQL